jgi:hypothetical protein
MHMLERVPACGLTPGVARACIANADDEDFGAHGPEAMGLLEVAFERVHQFLLDVQDASANLTDGVVMVAAGKLVVSGSLPKVSGVNRARRGERFERPVNSAARKSWFCSVQLSRNLLSCAMASQSHDGVVDHRPLRGAAHAWCERQDASTTRSSRSALESTRQPPASTTMSSSTRTPPHPGR